VDVDRLHRRPLSSGAKRAPHQSLHGAHGSNERRCSRVTWSFSVPFRPGHPARCAG